MPFCALLFINYWMRGTNEFHNNQATMKTYDFTAYCRNTKPFRFLASIQSDKKASKADNKSPRIDQ